MRTDALGVDVRDIRTVMAMPFPRWANEDAIRKVFEPFGRVKHIKLRRDKGTNAFSGSAWIEFETESAAQAAVRAPPRQLDNAATSLSVLTRGDVARQKSATVAGGRDSGGTPGGGAGPTSSSAPASASNGDAAAFADHQAAGSSGAAGTHSQHHHNSTSQHHQHQQYQGNSGVHVHHAGNAHHGRGSGGRNSSDGGGGASRASALAGHKRRSSGTVLPPPSYGDSFAAAAEGGAWDEHHQHSGGSWQKLAEERETRIRELEAQLQSEKAHSSSVVTKLTQATQRLDEASHSEAAARAKLLQKEVEIGSLKGEVAAIRSQIRSQADQLHMQYKTRLHDSEVAISKLKEDISVLRQRPEARAAAGAAAAVKVQPPTPPPVIRHEYDDL